MRGALESRRGASGEEESEAGGEEEAKGATGLNVVSESTATEGPAEMKRMVGTE